MRFDFSAVVIETSAHEQEVIVLKRKKGETELNCWNRKKIVVMADKGWIILGNDFTWQSVILKIKLQEQDCGSLHCRGFRVWTNAIVQCCKTTRVDENVHVMSTQSKHCSTLLFSHLHSPAFLAFLSSLPLHLTCCAELRDQLGATECSHHRSEHCKGLIRCVSHLRGAQPPFRLVVF